MFKFYLETGKYWNELEISTVPFLQNNINLRLGLDSKSKPSCFKVQNSLEWPGNSGPDGGIGRHERLKISFLRE